MKLPALKKGVGGIKTLRQQALDTFAPLSEGGTESVKKAHQVNGYFLFGNVGNSIDANVFLPLGGRWG